MNPYTMSSADSWLKPLPGSHSEAGMTVRDGWEGWDRAENTAMTGEITPTGDKLDDGRVRAH